MSLAIDPAIAPADLLPAIARMWELSAGKIRAVEETWRDDAGAPVITAAGKYAARGWTEWTEGFRYGSALLQFDATGERWFLDLGRTRTLERMAPHVTHFGVHDHGFNVVSTYGALWRLAGEDRFDAPPGERELCALALKASGAVQARRWTATADGGFIHSFNGPHSLFVDTIRSLRSLALAHLLGHELLEEQDERISLLDRLLQHGRATARYAVYYGEGRDIYDVRGRVAHESLFNPTNGVYRCPSTQQGYSPFTTWTRGLAWAILGFAEQVEFLHWLRECNAAAALNSDIETFTAAACATCDFYLGNTPTDGIPYWDTGAPGLAATPGWQDRPADPFNDHEPVDSSAAAIAAQGLLRLGRHLLALGDAAGRTYRQAGLTIARTLLASPYLAENPDHQGLLLHSVYHKPNGWDYVPARAKTSRGEASMWGDYHLRELALTIQRETAPDEGQPPYCFFGSGV